MTDITPYVPLKQCVAMALDEADKSSADFDKAWILAFRGLVDLGYDIAWEPTSVNIPLNGNKTADLPSDCISWTKIGVWNNSGEISTLKMNRALSIFKSANPNRLSQMPADITDNFLQNLPSYPFFVNYAWDYGYRNSYLDSGLVQYGECWVDEKNRVIIFDPNFRFDHVVLEYISSPEKNGDYEIQLACQEAVIAFVQWKLKIATEKDYYNRKIEARRRLKPVRLQIVDQIIRENQGFRLKG